MADIYRPGDNYVICDRCGFKHLASQVTKDWDGLVVCRADYDGRHPQDFVRGRPDHQTVALSRPESTDTFIGASDELLYFSDGEAAVFGDGQQASLPS